LERLKGVDVVWAERENLAVLERRVIDSTQLAVGLAE
jgi:hypothetical protein